MSAFSLLRDPRTLKRTDDNVRLSPATKASVSPPMTAIVLAPGWDNEMHKTIINLANVQYDLSIIFVCAEPDVRDPLNELLLRYKHTMPRFSVFCPKDRLTVLEGLTAGLQCTKTEFVCTLLGGDMVHMFAFDGVAAAVADSDADCCTFHQLKMNKLGWAQEVGWRKPVWRTQYLVQRGGFAGSDGRTLVDLESCVLGTVPDGRRIDSDDVLFCGLE